MTIFSQLVENNGQNLLANTIGLFVYLPNQTIPADVYQYIVDFCTKEVDKASRAATKATKVVVTEQKESMILRGKIIFDTHCTIHASLSAALDLPFNSARFLDSLINFTLCRLFIWSLYKVILTCSKTPDIFSPDLGFLYKGFI
jgi:hypothetical protein